MTQPSNCDRPVDRYLRSRAVDVAALPFDPETISFNDLIELHSFSVRAASLVLAYRLTAPLQAAARQKQFTLPPKLAEDLQITDLWEDLYLQMETELDGDESPYVVSRLHNLSTAMLIDWAMLARLDLPTTDVGNELRGWAARCCHKRLQALKRDHNRWNRSLRLVPDEPVEAAELAEDAPYDTPLSAYSINHTRGWSSCALTHYSPPYRPDTDLFRWGCLAMLLLNGQDPVAQKERNGWHLELLSAAYPALRGHGTLSRVRALAQKATQPGELIPLRRTLEETERRLPAALLAERNSIRTALQHMELLMLESWEGTWPQLLCPPGHKAHHRDALEVTARLAVVMFHDAVATVTDPILPTRIRQSPATEHTLSQGQARKVWRAACVHRLQNWGYPLNEGSISGHLNSVQPLLNDVLRL